MTETPANTPKPIGSTSSFFPGRSRGVGAPAFSELGFGVTEGCGVEEIPITPTGPGRDDTTPVPLELDGTESSELGRGTEVREVEITGGGTAPDSAGGKPVTAGVGESVSLVLVNVGDVDDGNGAGTGGLDPGGKAPGTLLPLSGVIVHVCSFLTSFTPFTTIGVRVILHVRMNVPAPVVIFSVVVTVSGDVRLDSCLGNTVDVCE